MASRIIGVTGKKYAGKDTFARRLIEAHGFTRLAFADTLKSVMEHLNPVIPVEADESGIVYGPGAFPIATHLRLSQILETADWDTAKKLREVRRLLQDHGVGIRQYVDPNVWVDVVRRKAEETDGPVIVTDVRFPNEAEWVQAAGGQLVRVYRNGQAADDTHVSETALDRWAVDAEIPNHDTIARLHELADEFLVNSR
ncbi:hypothetical protein JNUCC0626_18265 [Lentzea sp. JNUCC 0626]|uniref:deoxynucleotide monophosphate kinase family protein n=1 Tax=Lentzea sp. JNUCC 0626 TaxID=3367513 RepID=UPI00374881AE